MGCSDFNALSSLQINDDGACRKRYPEDIRAIVDVGNKCKKTDEQTDTIVIN